MSEPLPGAAETQPVATPAEPPLATPLTDDHAQALLADAITRGETASGGPQSDDPGTLHAEIARLHRENTSARTVAKQNAATEAREQLAQEIGKALGLIQDDEPIDPAQITAQLASQTEATKRAQTELAVYKAALDPNSAVKADPTALLDSRTFMDKVAALDPTDTAGIDAVIAEAVEANPRLGRPDAAPQVGMKPNRAQGASASPPPTLGDRIQAAEQSGDVKASLSLKSAQLLNTN